jgi:hypothetical protein
MPYNMERPSASLPDTKRGNIRRLTVMMLSINSSTCGKIETWADLRDAYWWKVVFTTGDVNAQTLAKYLSIESRHLVLDKLMFCILLYSMQRWRNQCLGM